MDEYNLLDLGYVVKCTVNKQLIGQNYFPPRKVAKDMKAKGLETFEEVLDLFVLVEKIDNKNLIDMTLSEDKSILVVKLLQNEDIPQDNMLFYQDQVNTLSLYEAAKELDITILGELYDAKNTKITTFVVD